MDERQKILEKYVKEMYYRNSLKEKVLKELNMTKQRTLSFIKPDAIKKNVIGDIINRFESNGLEIVAAKMVHLDETQAKEFYGVHKEKPFYGELVDYICSGPIMAMVLEGDNAILKNRELMGATDPQKAEKGTIRGDHGEHLGANVVHGSDATETAKTEINFFFGDAICSRS